MQQSQPTEITNLSTKASLVAPLTSQKPRELGKTGNRFVRPQVDSLLSTSSDSSNASSRNPSLGHRYDTKEYPSVDTKFPVFINKNKKTVKSAKLSSKLSRTSSFGDEMESPVTEEREEQERENQFLKKLPVIADAEEFNVKKTHANRFRGRELMYTQDNNRCRSLEASFLPLTSVEEVKNEEEQNGFRNRRRMQTIGMTDMNEFNQNERPFFERKDKRHLSMKGEVSKDVIVEEQENRVLPHLQTVFVNHSANGSRRGSILSSPGSKLKVDEIDFLDKNTEDNNDDSDDTPIDPIMEEAEEKAGQAEENKEFQVAKAKMNEEREFIRKISRSEMLDENDSLYSAEREYGFLGSTVPQDVIEEDNSENTINES